MLASASFLLCRTEQKECKENSLINGAETTRKSLNTNTPTLTSKDETEFWITRNENRMEDGKLEKKPIIK